MRLELSYQYRSRYGKGNEPCSKARLKPRLFRIMYTIQNRRAWEAARNKNLTYQKIPPTLGMRLHFRKISPSFGKSLLSFTG